MRMVVMIDGRDVEYCMVMMMVGMTDGRDGGYD